MKKVKCKNCVFSVNSFCDLTGVFIAEGTKHIECDAYEEDELDIDGMDLTDSEIYIRGELSYQERDSR